MTDTNHTDSYQTLLGNAPAHDTPEFLQYLRDNNPVLHENDEWLVINNFKYNHPTAFAKVTNPSIQYLIDLYGDREWRVKPKEKRSVTRFHIHIL